MERGTHISLCSTCNSDYARADKTSINQAINTIDWEDFFANKTVGSLVSELNTFNIYSNYISHKAVLIDGKDPPWITDGIRTAIEAKNNDCKEYIRSGMRHDYYIRYDRKVHPVIPSLLVNS